MQVDSSSLHVFEDLMSSLLPCWLSKTNDLDQLLQVLDLQFAHFLWQSVLYMQSV